MEGTIGEIRMYASPVNPVSWYPCDGRLLSVSSYAPLFSIIGTTYGGDGQTTFALPDLRGRDAVGTGQGPGLPTIALGQMGGANTMTLTVSQIPAHNHPVGGSVSLLASTKGTLINTSQGNVPGPGNFYADPEELVNMMPMPTTNLTVSMSGYNAPFSIMQPYLGMKFIICFEGIFPSRN